MPASPIRKLVPFAEAAKAAGRTVFHLNIGQPDIATPPQVFERLKSLDRTYIEYSNSEGFRSYREKLAGYYTSSGIAVQPEEVMITTGGSEALTFILQSIMDPGDEVVIPEPFYANYNGFASMGGINVVPVTATIDNGFALPPMDAFRQAITPNTRAVVICNPGNPTGCLYSQDELEQLAAIVREHDLWLIADEVYREFCYDGAQPFSVMNLTGLEQHAIMVDSVSKRYSMCGARVGALVSRNRSLLETALKFGQARLSPPTLGQVAGEAALETPQSYFEAVIGEYVERRNLVVDGLNAIPGVRCPKPSGAFYCIAELPVDNAEDFCQWMLESFQLNNETIMMAPAAGFYASPGMGKKEVRIAYVLELAALQRALACLKAGLAQYAELVPVGH